MWLAELLLIAFVPGALVFRVPFGERRRRAGLPAEERAYWAVVLSVAWSSVVVLSLAAAEHYSLGLLLGVNALVSVAVAVAWRERLLYRGTAAAPGWTALFPAALLALGFAIFLPVSEFIIGGKDPGVYINEGIALAQRGSLVITDKLVTSVPGTVRDLFFPPYNDRWYYSLRFMGFFLVNPFKGSVVGQFPHVYPAWIAVGYGLAGVAGALRVVAASAMLGLLGVYFVGARLIGRVPAWCAAALLALCVIESWFGRYPNSEMVLQALLFAGLLAFARSHVDDDPFFAPVAGLLLGLLVFVRFDAVLAWAGVGLAALFLFLRDRRPRWSFLAPMALAVAAVATYISTIMRPGFGRYAVFLQNLRPVHLVLLAAAAVAIVGLWFASRWRRLADGVTKWLPAVVSAAVVGAMIYAYYLRTPGGRLAPHDALSLRTFTWYFPFAGLVAAAAGFVLLAWKRFWRDPALLLVTTVYGFFVFYKIQIVPEHFWMTRRFLPVILPAAFLLLCAGAFYGTWSRRGHAVESRPLRIARWAVPLVFVAVVGALLARAAAPVRAHVEYQGLLDRIESLSHQFGPTDLVVVESRRSSDLHTIALPLAYIFGRQVLVLNTPRPDRDRFRGFLDWARSRYDNVYFVGSGGTDLLSRSVAVVPLSTARFQVPEYESLWNAYPTRSRLKEFDYSIYRFVTPPETAPPFDLTVGTNDDLFVVRFNAKEEINGQTYRWTTGSSYVTLLGLTEQSRSLTLWMDRGGRPAEAGPATVTCYLDNQPIGEVTVDRPGVQPYLFAIPPDLAKDAAHRDEPALLRLVVRAWSPKKLWGTDDDRTLGVMLMRVAVQ
jgi:hypothetical protein